jgi:hypothetical protein
VFRAELEPLTAVIVGGLVLVAATVIAIRRLTAIEIAGETA